MGNLLCCPEERATGNRSGCCNPGFVWVGPGNECCLEGKACNGECCPGTQVCIGGECQECPDSQELCFDTCCEPGSCCFGKCCPPGTICTGECTTLETISEQILQSSGGTLTSSDDAFEITFPAFATQQDVTVTYSSQQAPSHPLPPNTQLLRSFTLQAETGGGQQVTQFQQAYTMEVAYTESTLAAMNLASESTLQLLWWDGSQWTNMLPCLMCGVDRTNEEVIVRADHFSEFALVAQQHKVHLPVIIDG